MALSQVFAAVEAQLVSVMGGLGKPAPTFEVGKAGIAKSGAPPRIVFVPVAGPASPPDSRGGEPRSLWKRKVHVEMHVWGIDFDDAEALSNHLVAAVHAVMPGSYAMAGETWDTEAVTQRGTLCVLTAQFYIPWTDEAPTRAVIRTETIDGTIAQPVVS